MDSGHSEALSMGLFVSQKQIRRLTQMSKSTTGMIESSRIALSFKSGVNEVVNEYLNEENEESGNPIL